MLNPSRIWDLHAGPGFASARLRTFRLRNTFLASYSINRWGGVGRAVFQLICHHQWHCYDQHCKPLTRNPSPYLVHWTAPNVALLCNESILPSIDSASLRMTRSEDSNHLKARLGIIHPACDCDGLAQVVAVLLDEFIGAVQANKEQKEIECKKEALNLSILESSDTSIDSLLSQLSCLNASEDVSHRIAETFEVLARPHSVFSSDIRLNCKPLPCSALPRDMSDLSGVTVHMVNASLSHFHTGSVARAKVEEL